MIGDSWQSQSHLISLLTEEMHISYRDHGPHNLPANTRQVTASCDPRLLAPGWSRDRIAAAAACRISSDSKCWNDVEINHFLVCTTSLAGAEAPLHINIFCKHVVLIFQHLGLRVKQLLIFQSINFRTIKFTAGSRAVTAQNNKTNLCFASSRCPLSCLIPPDPMYYANLNAWILVENVRWGYWISQVQYVLFQMNGYFVYRS